ncbi:UDP-N-acetylmuramate dehydrogenase [Microbacteriaceae bacterium SG_E_30_P1]|uniref:UDP-N-acetylenolpyruvoylglucosamine reductase n=1 Tax=Antiquaquibacter oligotrophicus TaxID=2880260 RepID=A0ABT6KPR4_9MICO|nr:UDP-N-acetylmuramate dehydrogenase [Antiquaquibacter oligotrophicus]MDH6181979.1 UDP-N-acetylmuramate dehydrogenase [Antiquaquibacter oligotrophicus]UDF12352.1 UDP-N-acetylmuramate dehydrogenase [Antiquaquibacter oligotrophicus]
MATVDLAEYTTMHVGGPAREFIAAHSEQELTDAALEVWGKGDELLVLGGGSNVVIADDGFDGTVLHVETRGIEHLAAEEGAVRLRVAAGEPWDELVAYTVEQGWSGIEALSGIPGSSGAAPIQNIGAYGQELSSTLTAIDFLDYDSGLVERVTADDLGLAYRTSSIKRGRQGIVVAIELRLQDADTTVAGYDQLAAALGVDVGARVAVAEVRERVLALRASKGMVLDPNDQDSVSCGSFFTNPIVSENFARSLPSEAPRWLEPDDVNVKLSAAWLIERAGIPRGFSLPGSHAAISSKHTLAITNRGGATAAEVAELARYVRTRVLAQFGVLLHPEPNLIGVSV